MGIPKKEKEYILKSFIAAKENCESPWVLNYSEPLSNGLKLHQIFAIVGGCLGIVNLAIAIYLMVGHLRYWVNHQEQKQHIRIIFFIIFETLITFFSLLFYDASNFIDPVGQYYEGFAIIALFLLYLEIVVEPYEGRRYTSFSDVHRSIVESRSQYGSPGGKKLNWLRRCWICVFQVAIFRVVTLVAAEAIFGRNCPLSNETRYGKTAVQAVQSVSTGVAVAAIIGFERRLGNALLAHQKGFGKLFSFKAIVGLQALQGIIFPVLGETKVFLPKPPFPISYHDFTQGIPDLLFMFELTVSVTAFLWTYNSHRYQAQFKAGEPIKAGPFYAFISIFGLLDVFIGLISGFRKDDSHDKVEDISSAGAKADSKMVNDEETA